MKKIRVFVLIVAMLVMSLTGCAVEKGDEEKITAEELIDAAFDTDYMEYEMEYCMDISSEIDGVMDRADYKVSSTVIKNADVCYHDIYLDVEYSMDVYSYVQSMEVYLEKEGDTETVYVNQQDVWDSFSTESINETYLPKVTSDMFEDLEVEESKDGYVVTGKIKDFDILEDFALLALSEMSTSLEDCDSEIIFTFNEDKVLEKMEFEIMTEEEDTYSTSYFNDATIYSITLEVNFLSFEGDDIEIPLDEIEADSKEEVEETEDESTAVNDWEDVVGELTEYAYTNEYFNLGFSTEYTEYTLLTKSQIDEVYNSTLGLVGDDYASFFENATMVYDMIAADFSNNDNINMVIEQTYATVDTYMVASKASIENLYSSMGYSDASITETTVDFMGESHVGIEMQYESDGARVYQLQSYIDCGEYIMVITATSWESMENCETLFSLIYNLY